LVEPPNSLNTIENCDDFQVLDATSRLNVSVFNTKFSAKNAQLPKEIVSWKEPSANRSISDRKGNVVVAKGLSSSLFVRLVK
jgi:hypothetical protein